MSVEPAHNLLTAILRARGQTNEQVRQPIQTAMGPHHDKQCQQHRLAPLSLSFSFSMATNMTLNRAELLCAPAVIMDIHSDIYENLKTKMHPDQSHSNALSA